MKKIEQASWAGISRLSPKSAALAQEKTIIIRLLTRFSDDGVVIGYIADGKMDWKVSKSAHA